MRRHLALALLCLGGSFTVNAHEAEAPRATVGMQFSGLKYSSTINKTQGAGVSASKKTTSTVTSDLVDAYIWVSTQDFNFYLYPFQDGNALVSLGYMINQQFELGLDFGYNTTRDDQPKYELTRTIYGVFATHFLPLGAWTLESLLLYDISRGKSEKLNGLGIEQTTTIQGSFLKLSATAVYPLRSNLWYYASLWYSVQDEKDSSDITDKYQQVSLTIAGLRLAI